MERNYWIRFGLRREVARFAFEGEPLGRGQSVVIRTHRGTELGEVVAPAEFGDAAPIVRVASADDFARSIQVRREATTHFTTCQKFFSEGVWPIDILDVEPLLDPHRTVLHYLGPHRLDASGLVAALRDLCGLDVVLEPVGLDVEDEGEPVEEEHDHGCGSCSSGGGGCGTGGGCSTGGCSGCSIKDLVASRQRPDSVAV